ncbi:MAG: hypothetical protein Q8R32_03275 [bacterium]|nr:hypothetical protein [bacterium]
MKPRVVLWTGLLGVLGIVVALLLVLGSVQGYLQARIPVSPAEELVEVDEVDAGECVRTCERSCGEFPAESDTLQCLQECRGWCAEPSGE